MRREAREDAVGGVRERTVAFELRVCKDKEAEGSISGRLAGVE
jgi:hypothetical protein